MSECLIVIPARLGSSRLPGKLLLRETGKSVLQHTYEAACRAVRPNGVVVAADGEEIAREVRRFGGQVVLTSPQAASGTDRVAEVAAARSDVEILVNVQGDEPEIAPATIDGVIAALERDLDAPMATMATPIRSSAQLADPACVKVVRNDCSRAMYFSRSPIPFARDVKVLPEAECSPYLQHLGIYAFRRSFLMEFAGWPVSELERIECLEQLRVLARGHAIALDVVQETTVGIDTPADYAGFVQRYRALRERSAA